VASAPQLRPNPFRSTKHTARQTLFEAPEGPASNPFRSTNTAAAIDGVYRSLDIRNIVRRWRGLASIGPRAHARAGGRAYYSSARGRARVRACACMRAGACERTPGPGRRGLCPTLECPVGPREARRTPQCPCPRLPYCPRLCATAGGLLSASFNHSVEDSHSMPPCL
jgi:hypothetical protein